MTTKRSTKRPITVALNIVKRMHAGNYFLPPSRGSLVFGKCLSPPSHARLLAILTELNAAQLFEEFEDELCGERLNAASGTTDARTATRRAKAIAKNSRAAR